MAKSINDLVDSIKTSTYGYDVRKSIAEAILAISDTVDQAVSITIDGQEQSIIEYVQHLVEASLNDYYTSAQTDEEISSSRESIMNDLLDLIQFVSAKRTQSDISFPDIGYLRSNNYINTSNATYLVSDYIPVIGGQNMIIDCTGGTMTSYAHVLFYRDGDQGKVVVGDAVPPYSGGQMHTYSFQTPENAEYLRFTAFAQDAQAHTAKECYIKYVDESLISILNDIFAAIHSIQTTISGYSSLESTVSTLSTNLSGIPSRLTTAEATIAGHGAAITAQGALNSGYNQSIAALETSTADLTDDISALNEVVGTGIELDADNFPTPGYLNGAGLLRSTTGSFATSDYILVDPGSTVVVNFFNPTKYFRFCFYDASRNYLSSYPSEEMDTTSRITVSIPVPEGSSYIRLSAKTSSSAGEHDEVADNIVRLSDPIDLLDHATKITYFSDTLEHDAPGYFAVPFPHMSSDKRITSETSSGVVVPVIKDIAYRDTYGGVEYPRYWLSDWIDVKGIDRIKLVTVMDGTTGYCFAKGKQLFAYGSPTSSASNKLSTFVIDVPSDADFFAFSTTIYNTSEEYALDIQNSAGQISSIQAITTGESYQEKASEIIESQRMTQVPYEKLLQGPVLCIGDSLTKSSIPISPAGDEGNGRVAVVTYPDWLASLTGLTVTARAKSGVSAQEWWKDSSLSKDFSGINTFVVWLGTNDGPVTDPDEAREESEDAAHSQTYYYCRILDEIITDSPTAKIFLGQVFASTNDIDSVNAVIDRIAETYPDNVVGVAKLNDGSLMGPGKENLHRGYSNNPHFSDAGYFYLANKWLSEIRNCIFKNIQMFDSPVTLT